jgi:hypothetical protein
MDIISPDPDRHSGHADPDLDMDPDPEPEPDTEPDLYPFPLQNIYLNSTCKPATNSWVEGSSWTVLSKTGSLATAALERFDWHGGDTSNMSRVESWELRDRLASSSMKFDSVLNRACLLFPGILHQGANLL